MIYYHGSFKSFNPGTVLKGRGDDYERDWAQTDFYIILELNRPLDCLPHKDAVFFVDHPDLIDAAGGNTNWCLEIEALISSRHDLNWCTQISCLLSEGFKSDSMEILSCAKSYWQGIEHPDGAVWEYLAKEGTVIRCEPFEKFRVRPEKKETLSF